MNRMQKYPLCQTKRYTIQYDTNRIEKDRFTFSFVHVCAPQNSFE